MESRDVELGVGILVIVLVGAFLFLGIGPETGPGETTNQQTQSGQNGGSEQTQERAATITIDDNGFQPSSITLAAGEVEIIVRNTAMRTHGFTLLEYGIDQLIPAESSRTFTFTATPGTYTFSDTITPENTGTLIIQ